MKNLTNTKINEEREAEKTKIDKQKY